ncbi:DUF2513 domain-containing protein [Alcaligenes endophyticus]|uniref:DUF2513 domain-containing protein n=1 Tax=Alcaligenes endophyticus TaxID=1929088 RepID=A0ABT8ENF9_9BURK|nr:DUF2513 domain-containing protein [Alcaligenes endophyticus]MCX5592852.1 DUF2513 domain-containing protein [Alcaligenes endophyticus]MDN4122857.1 DUF2513 domain-containing protein [Alcaligenes endophyticus]
MKRDMDLIRKITLATEQLPPNEWLEGIEGIEDAIFAGHARWMKEARLVEASIEEYLDGSTSTAIKRLTWDGCNFADEIRSDTLWKKAKENVLKPSMSFSFSVLREWLKAEITQGLPSIRGGA